MECTEGTSLLITQLKYTGCRETGDRKDWKWAWEVEGEVQTALKGYWDHVAQLGIYFNNN